MRPTLLAETAIATLFGLPRAVASELAQRYCEDQAEAVTLAEAQQLYSDVINPNFVVRALHVHEIEFVMKFARSHGRLSLSPDLEAYLCTLRCPNLPELTAMAELGFPIGPESINDMTKPFIKLIFAKSMEMRRMGLANPCDVDRRRRNICPVLHLEHSPNECFIGLPDSSGVLCECNNGTLDPIDLERVCERRAARAQRWSEAFVRSWFPAPDADAIVTFIGAQEESLFQWPQDIFSATSVLRYRILSGLAGSGAVMPDLIAQLRAAPFTVFQGHLALALARAEKPELGRVSARRLVEICGALA